MTDCYKSCTDFFRDIQLCVVEKKSKTLAIRNIYVVANVQIQLMYTLADMFQLMCTLAESQLMYYRLAS